MSTARSNLLVEVVRALARGDRIEPIGLVRRITRQGLGDAQEGVDREGAFPVPTPSLPVHPAYTGQADPGHGSAPGEQPRVPVASALH